MKIAIILTLIVLGLIGLLNKTVFSQEGPITQEQFAVELVKSMEISDHLPLAALPRDCVMLLETIGISPLKGWDRKALLTDDDYTVIVAKSVGKEKLVHTKATEVCLRTIAVINARWQKKPNLSLHELLNDLSIFPEGPPKCPYGLKYEDKNSDTVVDPHYHSVLLSK